MLNEMILEGHEYPTFDEVLADYKVRISQVLLQQVEECNIREQKMARISPVPFLSGTFETCIERALDKTLGGAKYNFTGFLGMELPNAANALMGIKRAVFEEQKISLRELREVMVADFQDSENTRQYLRNRVPKFGNDDDSVDFLLQDVAGYFVDEVLKHANTRGGRYLPGFFDFGNFIRGAKGIGATPDGRHAGEACSVHISPAVGTDKNGATANLQSFAKVCKVMPPLGAIMDVKFHPSAVNGREGFEKLEGFIDAFLELGCLSEQTNVVDGETLRKAQKHPEDYKDLMVRVWGFSAYFSDLTPDFQEHIIARTAHQY